MENYFQMKFTPQQLTSVSTLGLAHVGDGVFDVLCRAYLCAKGDQTVLKLHKDTVNLVKAPTQAKFADKLKPLLTEEEMGYFRRGKNAHTHAAPKSATPRNMPKPPDWKPYLGHCIYWDGQSGSTSFLTS